MSLVGPRPPLPREVELRRPCAPQVHGQARDHRALAGQRPLVAVVGGVGAARPVVRRELDARRRRRDPAQDRSPSTREPLHAPGGAARDAGRGAASSASGSSRRAAPSASSTGLASLFPDADILCLWNDAPARYPAREVGETWLARTPLRRHKALALPVMPATWRVPRRGYDWALVELPRVRASRRRRFGPKCPSSSTCTRLPGTCGRRNSMRAATTSPPAGRSRAPGDRPACIQGGHEHRGEQPLRRRPRRARLGPRGHRHPSPGRCRVDPRRAARDSAHGCRASRAGRAAVRLRARRIAVHPVQAPRRGHADAASCSGFPS